MAQRGGHTTCEVIGILAALEEKGEADSDRRARSDGCRTGTGTGTGTSAGSSTAAASL